MIDLSPMTASLQGRPAAVFGLGLSGLATVRAFVSAGVAVTAWDDDESRRAAARDAGAAIADLNDVPLENFAMLVLAPGIPLHFPEPHNIVARARDAGVEILGDIELLHRTGHGRKVVGVTGTNGKSTTTALIGHILTECGVAAVVGGNIGHAALDIHLPDENGVIVLELSSYQLDLCPTFAPDIAVHLNLTPDHLDRHGDMDGYMAAKKRIFRGAGYAVVGVDDDLSKKMAADVVAAGDRAVYGVSVGAVIDGGVYAESGELIDATDDEIHKIGPIGAFPTLPGLHNQQNIAAAYAVCRILGVEPGAIMAAAKTYPGLPHRLFMTRVINGIAYINDSKATNADAAARALASYRNIYWIAGGKPKDGGLKGVDPYMDRVRQAFLIGDAADSFATWLNERGVAYVKSGTLDRAVIDAHNAAQADRGQPGGTGVVLLSPACASFDQFRSFEHRGDEFTRLVNELPEDAAE